MGSFHRVMANRNSLTLTGFNKIQGRSRGPGTRLNDLIYKGIQSRLKVESFGLGFCFSAVFAVMSK